VDGFICKGLPGDLGYLVTRNDLIKCAIQRVLDHWAIHRQISRSICKRDLWCNPLQQRALASDLSR